MRSCRDTGIVFGCCPCACQEMYLKCQMV
uniref:Uncharacterized protein n=1 Tax=Anguilla anguilla TaxID=7936 RepID=A0A0E9VST5_ANGAN